MVNNLQYLEQQKQQARRDLDNRVNKFKTLAIRIENTAKSNITELDLSNSGESVWIWQNDDVPEIVAAFNKTPNHGITKLDLRGHKIDAAGAQKLKAGIKGLAEVITEKERSTPWWHGIAREISAKRSAESGKPDYLAGVLNITPGDLDRGHADIGFEEIYQFRKGANPTSQQAASTLR